MLKPQVLVSPFLCFALSSEQFLNAGEKNQLQLFQTLGNYDPCVAWEGFGENPGADLSEIAIFIPFLSSQHSRDFFCFVSQAQSLWIKVKKNLKRGWRLLELGIKFCCLVLSTFRIIFLLSAAPVMLLYFEF